MSCHVMSRLWKGSALQHSLQLRCGSYSQAQMLVLMHNKMSRQAGWYFHAIFHAANEDMQLLHTRQPYKVHDGNIWQS